MTLWALALHVVKYLPCNKAFCSCFARTVVTVLKWSRLLTISQPEGHMYVRQRPTDTLPSAFSSINAERPTPFLSLFLSFLVM